MKQAIRLAAYREDNEPHVLTPDAVYPEQFLPRFIDRSPEARLALAVLTDAFTCYQKYIAAKTLAGRRRFAEADDWIFTDEPVVNFDYIGLCVALQINPDELRRRLLCWRDSPLRVARTRKPHSNTVGEHGRRVCHSRVPDGRPRGRKPNWRP